MIGGTCGGIKLQIVEGECGFLVDTVEECAQRMLTLLTGHPLAQRMGHSGKERVRNRCLMPRLLVDYLAIFQEITSGSPSPQSKKAAEDAFPG